MLKWITLIIGLIILALGIVVLIEGSQEIVGIVIIAVSALVILLGIGLLLKKKAETQKSTPAATEPDEEPPVF
jgi:threonine/homoserine/homoserine lactone efflux protein